MVRFYITIIVGLIVFLSTHSEARTITTECEEALQKAAAIAMIYSTTGTGFKAMIHADNAADIICGRVSS